MKAIKLLALIPVFLLAGCDTLNQTAQILTQGQTPTQSEIALGLKEALQFGTINGAAAFHRKMVISAIWP